MQMIQPRTLKGFRDFLPEAMIPREKLVATAQQVYRSFGYSPIDTPILEYLEILQGKGGDESDRLMYHFEDHGGRAVGMRFDLTVPLARFAAQHAAELGMPFKRYHIAKVWRGENTHRGRYREFMQCDFDTIGTESIAADIETVLVVHELMQAIGLSEFQIRFNNRKVLSGLLAKLGLADQSTAVLRALDKLAKIGPDKVAMEMVAVAGASESQAKEVLALAEINGTNDEILLQLAKLVEGSEEGEAGVAALRDVTTGALAAGVSADRLSIDVSIARGLDYYTGTVIETFLKQLAHQPPGFKMHQKCWMKMPKRWLCQCRSNDDGGRWRAWLVLRAFLLTCANTAMHICFNGSFSKPFRNGRETGRRKPSAHCPPSRRNPANRRDSSP